MRALALALLSSVAFAGEPQSADETRTVMKDLPAAQAPSL